MNWKKAVLIAVGWGFGTAAGLAIAAAIVLWYQGRPKPPRPPRPWDTKSIRAQYDDVNTEGGDNYIVFSYVLENTTDFDYRVEDGRHITISAKLHSGNELSPFGDVGKIDYPIFVPARKRVRFAIHINYAYPTKEKQNPSPDESSQYQKAIEQYVKDQFRNLDGFDLLDDDKRYEIIFPDGWRHSK